MVDGESNSLTFARRRVRMGGPERMVSGRLLILRGGQACEEAREVRKPDRLLFEPLDLRLRGRAVGEDQRVLAGVVQPLQRCSWFHDDESATGSVVSLWRIAEQDRGAAVDDAEDLLLRMLDVQAALRPRRVAP